MSLTGLIGLVVHSVGPMIAVAVGSRLGDVFCGLHSIVEILTAEDKHLSARSGQTGPEPRPGLRRPQRFRASLQDGTLRAIIVLQTRNGDLGTHGS
jgi:hypothetical protein